MEQDNIPAPVLPAEEEKKEDKPVQVSIQQAILINALIIAVAIIIAGFVVHGPFTGGNSLGANSAGTTAATGTTASAAAVDIKNVNMTGEPYIGNPNAPVTLAYWSDYQCPYCKEFETETLPTIIQNYVSSGKVKVVFKDFSFLGPDSDTAATYARSVWNLYPAQFFAWRTAMFNAQDAENSGFGDEPSIVKLTATIPGIDVSKVSADVAQNGASYLKEAAADKAEAVSFGIQGTPSFITGTTLIPGVVPYSTFQTDINAQLK